MKSEAVVAAIASGEVDFSGQFATAIRQRLAGIPITAVGAVISRSTRQSSRSDSTTRSPS